MAKKNKNTKLIVTSFAFVFVASCAIWISDMQSTTNREQLVLAAFSEGNTASPITKFAGPDVPVKTPAASYPEVSAFAVYAMDVDSGTVFFEKNPEISVLPASTTKIMTALVALELYSLDQVVVVPPHNSDGQKMKLVTSEQITVRDLLYGLLVFSANDAADVLSLNHPEGKQAFIAHMNSKAKQLGMNNTQFQNPSGLEQLGHFSTARDMTLLSVHAMKDPVFSQIVGTKNITVYNTDKTIAHRLVAINKLIGEVDGVLGVKTGWTENAKENLVSFVRRGDRSIAISLLGSDDRFGETTKLIEWIYSSYSWNHVIEEN
jgi:serine-type D-Ala-D-Ala carboxypeptidase (penicillin-binding protein 5/6)